MGFSINGRSVNFIDYSFELNNLKAVQQPKTYFLILIQIVNITFSSSKVFHWQRFESTGIN